VTPHWLRRPVLGWALYDWANSAFALTIMTSFMPVLLKGYWNDGAPSPVSTFRLGMANSIGGLAVALISPVLGAMADYAGRRKALLVVFTAVGVVTTAGLYAVHPGGWLVAATLYVVASIGFAASNSLYDSLLLSVAAPQQYDRVSAFGYGLGYLGSALLFTVNVLAVIRPSWFGFADSQQAMRFACLVVAVWWALFTVPLVMWVRESRSADRRSAPIWLAGFSQLARTLRSVRSQRNLFLFLLAYWLYIDGVYTIINMAVDFGLALGLTPQGLIAAILLTNYVAFPAAILFGRIGEQVGTRTGIYLGLSVYVAGTLASVFIRSEAQFMALAVGIGLVQGGVQSLSRSFFARLIPADQTGEYFGFYNMLGKFAAILGPMLVGVAALLSGSERMGILSILILFAAGASLLLVVRDPARAEVGTA
jgi:UMF1 family MFS transporter